MSEVAVVKSLLLAVPLAFLAARCCRAGCPCGARLQLGLAGGWLAALALTLLVPAGLMAYLVSFAIVGSIYAVIALGLNVQWGYTGLFNIGIAAFFAVGAFTSALVTTKCRRAWPPPSRSRPSGSGAPFLVGVLAAGVVAGMLARWSAARRCACARLPGHRHHRHRRDGAADLPERALAGQRAAAAARHPAAARLPVRDPPLRLAAGVGPGHRSRR
jgi:hypothetical protein